MKKPTKMKLAKETLSQLDALQLRQLASGLDTYMQCQPFTKSYGEYCSGGTVCIVTY